MRSPLPAELLEAKSRRRSITSPAKLIKRKNILFLRTKRRVSLEIHGVSNFTNSLPRQGFFGEPKEDFQPRAEQAAEAVGGGLAPGMHPARSSGRPPAHGIRPALHCRRCRKRRPGAGQPGAWACPPSCAKAPRTARCTGMGFANT